MADSAAPTTPRATRNGSTKPRASTVSTDTENKLARAARSAQRLAQLTEPPREEGNLDLFPDDAERAAQQAASIDIRQGTLSGFELPGELLAAANAATAASVDASVATADAKATRRASRAAKVDRGAVASTDADGVTPEAVAVRGEEGAGGAIAAAERASSEGGAGATVAVDAAQTVAANEVASNEAAGTEAQSESESASASLMRDIVALQQAHDAASEAAHSGVSASGRIGAMEPRPRLASNVARAASAPRDSGAWPGQARDGARGAPRVTPELDHARATAFADTVDALYGVIADQRRAAGEHSRRMKWLLSIVVCALLVTVAIGIAQTLLLMRLTRDTTLQQQRIEQMILNQQATLSTLLDTDSATVSAPAFAPTPAPSQAAPRASTPSAANAEAAAASKHATKPHHAHKPKQNPSSSQTQTSH
ncbi:hypothetical protein [Paraburkholderia phosphatilytica]|uniref:hypothetical protein n=1 Tax=Paraburkholderia phosphatilytica TaxID=2282883 RepID=UPI000E511DBB|nr:hypothetical protein [Paraburkholderia phosphatilytica]